MEKVYNYFGKATKLKDVKGVTWKRRKTKLHQSMLLFLIWLWVMRKNVGKCFCKGFGTILDSFEEETFKMKYKGILKEVFVHNKISGYGK